MDTKQKARGSWGVRFFIAVLGVILGILFYWLLSFIEGDIGRIKGPDWNEVRKKHISGELDQQHKDLKKEVAELNRSIDTLLERKKNVYQSVTNLQNTINQLLSIQRESISKNIEFPEESVRTLRESQTAFLEYQKEDLKYTQEISSLTVQLHEKQIPIQEIEQAIRTQEKAASEELRILVQTHRMKTAAMKLAFLVPVFVAAAFLFLKFRAGAYWAMVWAIFLASFIKIAFIVHEYFPSKYFKYIALLAIMGIVVRILMVLIRMVIAPKKDLLLKQYQQHYDKCICPVCSKPIRSGPLRFIGALGKKARVMAGQPAGTAQQDPYTCPSCGTGLYHKCSACGHVRHTLLPYCEHCGHNKTPEQ